MSKKRIKHNAGFDRERRDFRQGGPAPVAVPRMYNKDEYWEINGDPFTNPYPVETTRAHSSDRDPATMNDDCMD